MNARLFRSTRLLVAAATAAALSAAVLAGTGAGPADAHTSVKSSRPAAGTTAKTNITVVAVIFNGDVRSAKVTVKGPGGTVVSKSTARDPRDDHRFQTALKRGLKPGAYTAAWGITAADGHRQSGSWSFRLER
jgi:copper resistance protein C